MKARVQEKLLLRLLFQDEPYTEEALAILTKDLVPDNESLEYLLMLGLLGTRNHWLYFPKEIRSRAEGVYKSVRVKNIYNIPWLKEQISILREHDIPVLFLKGMAMRAYYAPEIPRQMSDFDLAVPPECFNKAKDYLSAAGYNIDQLSFSLHSVTLNYGDGKKIDLHHWIFKTNSRSTADIWERALLVDYQGYPVVVPDPVDMFIHVVDNHVRDHITDIYLNRRMKWLLDTRIIIEKTGDWDWKEVAGRAEELGSLTYLKYAMKEFAEMFPSLLKETELKAYFSPDAAYAEWETGIKKYRKAFLDYIEQRHQGRVNPFMMIKYWWLFYHSIYADEMRESGENDGFIKFICKAHGVSGFFGLLSAYCRLLFKRETDKTDVKNTGHGI